MKNPFRGILLKKFFLLIFILFLIILLLINHEIAFQYASNGLLIWFNRMIPTLFPFMVISGILLRTGTSKQLAKLFYPVIGKLFSLSYDCVYIIIMGFLCGFPMGAAMIADSLKLKRITKEEGNLLLSFTNNIGPVYFLSFVCVKCPCFQLYFAFMIMYFIPFLYGLILRYSVYQKRVCIANNTNCNFYHNIISFSCLNESLQSAIQNITLLGGYMICFNLLNMIPILFLSKPLLLSVVSVLIEISGGITNMIPYPKYYPFVYILLPFGGLSCIFQTFSLIHEYGLSIKAYVFHKLMQTIITFFVYVCVFFFS